MSCLYAILYIVYYDMARQLLGAILRDSVQGWNVCNALMVAGLVVDAELVWEVRCLGS